jgi:Xaa-Pro aminopeptidase
MLDPIIHARRRTHLSQALDAPILLMGHGHRPRNLPMSPLPFRQDSRFLYFTGCTHPGAALLIVEGQSVLYLPKPSHDDALWHGASHSIQALGTALGFSNVRPSTQLEIDAKALNGLATIAVPDLAQTQKASQLSKSSLEFGSKNGHEGLISAIIAMRRRLDTSEVDEMRSTAKVTRAAHLAAIAATHHGAHEQHIAAAFHDVVMRAGLSLAYPSIVTVRGEVLHNFNYVNTLQDGQLLLLDGGAESKSGYATDVTRTWPVSGRFSPRQKAAYEAVLESQLRGIALVRSGTRYRDVHIESALVLAQFLADEGLVKCSPEDAVACGAHALFFPHGVGHLIGLDVHDLENFGDQAAYAPGRVRSEQFGLGYLRLDLDLEPGMVVTVEPGFYVIPAILDAPEFRSTFSSTVDFERAAAWRGFGGIRIEDDVLVTDDKPEVLTGSIPKTVLELESAYGG